METIKNKTRKLCTLCMSYFYQEYYIHMNTTKHILYHQHYINNNTDTKQSKKTRVYPISPSYKTALDMNYEMLKQYI